MTQHRLEQKGKPSLRITLSEAVNGFPHLAQIASCIKCPFFTNDSSLDLIVHVDTRSIMGQFAFQVHDLVTFLGPCAMQVEFAIRQDYSRYVHLSDMGKVALVEKHWPHMGVCSVGFHVSFDVDRAASA